MFEDVVEKLGNCHLILVEGHENILEWLKFVCVRPLCLTNLHAIVYKQKHM